jgi:hypothetical protein
MTRRWVPEAEDHSPGGFIVGIYKQWLGCVAIRLYRVLMKFKEQYGNPKLFVTENAAHWLTGGIDG